MHKLSFYRSSENLISKNFINFIATVLVLLITFNLGWLIALIRLCTQFHKIGNLSKTFLNLESILLLGNLGFFILFVVCALGLKNLKSIVSKR